MRIFPRCFLVVSVVFALALLNGCQTVPFTDRQQLILVSDAEVNSLAAATHRQILSKSRLSTNEGEVNQVRRVGERMAGVTMQYLRNNSLPTDGYTWEFNVIKNDEVVNAGCLPGGKIIVWTGILPIAQTDTGLAVILGHEIAHAVAKHSNERMSQQKMAGLTGGVLSSLTKQQDANTHTNAMKVFGFGAQYGVLLPFSRTHEAEADEIGLHLMAMAGYDPREAIPFWERMAQKTGPRPPEFLSSHPAPETRIGNLRQLLPIVMPVYEMNKKAN